mgnify:CR=1 FL=1
MNKKIVHAPLAESVPSGFVFHVPLGHKINKPAPLFEQISDEQVEAFRVQHAGSQQDREARANIKFPLDLKCGVIKKVQDHPTVGSW